MEQAPTIYDSFYKNSRIICKLAEFKDIRDYFSKYNVSLETTFLGYLYLVELAILNVIRDIEDLIEDDSLSERIQWGEITVEDLEVKKELETHPEGCYIVDLLSIRRKLSGMRFKSNYDDASIVVQLNLLCEIIAKFDENTKERFAVTRINENRLLEKQLILKHICYNYVLIRFRPGVELFCSTSNYEAPMYPGLAFFNLMPKSQQCNYFLQHNEIKKNDSNYLKGYSTCLSYLYLSFRSSKSKEIGKELRDVNSWDDVHNIGESILDDLNTAKEMNQRIFEMNYQTTVVPLGKSKIEKYIELRRIFKDRFVRVFPNWDFDESLFVHYLIGAVELFKRFNRFKPTLIKFRIDTESDYFPIRYYALFNPMRGWISDGSHWLVFRDNSEHASLADVMVKEVVEEDKDQLDYFEYAIDENLIRKYLTEMAYGTAKETREVEIKKASHGLIGEFLAAFYILKEYGADKLLALEVHHQIRDTDIDVLAKTAEETVIGQVKSNLSFNPEDNKAILENFKKVSKHLQIKMGRCRMVLFLMYSEIPDSEIGILLSEDINEENIETGILCIDPDIARKKHDVESYFKQHDVEIILLDKVIETLKAERCYQDLVNKLKLILIDERMISFDPRSLLWLDNYKLLLHHPDS